MLLQQKMKDLQKIRIDWVLTNLYKMGPPLNIQAMFRPTQRYIQ
jgi:hypothetical protein